MLALSDRAFIAEVEKRMRGAVRRGRAGGAALVAIRSASTTPRKITAQRLALVGDAAHGIHPIAGQGLNLGLRDVGALVEVIADGMRLGLEPGDAQLLARYERWRGLDGFMVALATDGLTRLFGIPGRLPARSAASAWARSSARRRSSAGSWTRRAAFRASCPSC